MELVYVEAKGIQDWHIEVTADESHAAILRRKQCNPGRVTHHTNNESLLNFTWSPCASGALDQWE